MNSKYLLVLIAFVLAFFNTVRAEAGFGAGDAIALILGLMIFFVCCFAGLGWLSRRSG